ncbi:MAG: hypothetical protein QXF26_02660 [Candidatus Bathyarchaeia archaeon]
MRVLLVPWSRVYGFSLRIYRQPSQGYINPPNVELRTFRGQRLLEKYADEKTLTTYNPGHSLRLAVMVNVPDKVCRRLLAALAALSRIGRPVLHRRSFEELAENPTLERLEQALALTKLVKV